VVNTVSLRCTCGAVKGTALGVSSSTATRLVCMCDDCQTSAHHLGNVNAILDANGGTEVVQLTPSQIRIHEGIDQIGCLRLSPKGLMRWYARCCDTPIANTLPSPRTPFAGVVHTFWKPELDGHTCDEVVGPVVARVQGRFGRGVLPPDAHQRAPVGVILVAGWRLLKGFVGGKHQPSPFFRDGKPVVEPTVLTLEQRDRARAAASAGDG